MLIAAVSCASRPARKRDVSEVFQAQGWSKGADGYAYDIPQVGLSDPIAAEPAVEVVEAEPEVVPEIVEEIVQDIPEVPAEPEVVVVAEVEAPGKLILLFISYIKVIYNKNKLRTNVLLRF